MKAAGSELDLTTANGRFAGLCWRSDVGPRTLCLHGWLDNAASFLPLAQWLETLDLVALDLAGHGHSAHRPRGARYYFMDNLWDVDAVLDALGWESCTLVGHSLGGALSCAFAAAAPERVERLVLLDGLGPATAGPEQTIERLRRSRASVRHATGRLREYPDLEAAVAARRAVSDLSEEAARVLCRRALERHGDHFRWRNDPGLNWTSPSQLMEEQVLEILRAIAAPVLSVFALPLARWIDEGAAATRRVVLAHGRHESVEGHHHFHMEQPQQIARLILEFLQETEH